MKSTPKKFLLACSALSLLGGCVGMVTGNKNVDAVNYTAAGLIDAAGSHQREKQKAFEQDLEKKTQHDR
jgi:hypothetical protein